MSLHTISHELARRIPLIHEDSVINNAGLIEELLKPLLNNGWRRVTNVLPPMDTPCWLWDGKKIWIGGRGMVDSESWLWGNAYSSIWHNGVKWEADNEVDDDYQPTHWMALPNPPNENNA